MLRDNVRNRLSGILTRVICISLLVPDGPSRAASPGEARARMDDMVAFDTGFRNGQEQFDRGDFLAAARTWTATAALLRETPETRNNRVAIFEYIADAYQRLLTNGASEPVLREALEVLDAYSEDFIAAYPDAEVPPRVQEARAKFHAILDVEGTPREETEPDREPTPLLVPAKPPPYHPRPTATSRRWKGLVAGGGLVLGGGVAMLGVIGVGLARVLVAKHLYTDPENGCSLSLPAENCAGWAEQANTGRALQGAGLAAGPLMVAAGAAMLAVGLKRRSARLAWAPVLGPRMFGLVWERRF